MPALPKQIEVHRIPVDHSGSETYVGNEGQGFWVRKLYDTFQWYPLVKWMEKLETKVRQQNTAAINKFSGLTVVKERGYAPPQGTVTTHTYDFSWSNLMKALTEIGKNDPCALMLVNIIRAATPAGQTFRGIMTGGYSSERTEKALRELIIYVVYQYSTTSYNGQAMAHALIDYFEKTHEVS